ncbi:MAG TPA: ligase-associated DNA damage response DEXH box helicase [Flavipsychrobacter sp.]|nr:ligase-associated DNA damage response DEXH box helicase [Flavipsychrobacter sp.]
MNFPIATEWFSRKEWIPHDFQLQCWKAIAQNYSGLLNAPTGYGKTYAIWFGILEHFFAGKKQRKGLHCLWITPLRALSKEIHAAAQRVSDELGLDYEIALRTGDTSAKERLQQKKNTPHALITTPESVHLLMAQKGYETFFSNLEFVVIDEWHELLGTKRAVLAELALSRLKSINPKLKTWGISATIGNLDEAKEVLLGSYPPKNKLIKAELNKKINVHTLLPDTIEKYPWAGHLGLNMLDEVLPIIEQNHSTLIFTNTRWQCEMWYQSLLTRSPDLAGIIALHHGSLSDHLRLWVEQALHDGILKAVVCTSSLDLGVDFRPVNAVVQIGSPKGVARFMQRAGRSGHQPGAVSTIHFLPTHSLEIVEGSALRHAMGKQELEQRIPYVRSFDVLIQYLVTLAVSDGFEPDRIFEEIKTTFCCSSVTREEFNWCLKFITVGGESLDAYDEYHKVVVENGLYKVTDRAIAMRHRLSIGAIVSDSMIKIKFTGGKAIGSVEEYFISKLNPGDVFVFAGRTVELVRVNGMVAQVKASSKKNRVIPSWRGSKMPLSSQLSKTIRLKLDDYYDQRIKDPEIKKLIPLFEEQQRRSHVPKNTELLVEKVKTREGYHIFFYPFEGRNVHEGLAALFAYRLSLIKPLSFSISMNDYGFELLCDQEIPLEAALEQGLFKTQHLFEDISKTVNLTEMARRKFRDIASIAGLVFNGFPGRQVKTRHLQASSQLFFNVFTDHEANNLLLRQAYEEVMTFQMEEVRILDALRRMQQQTLIIKEPDRLSPFSFPIYAESLNREKLTNEAFEEKVHRIIKQLEK